MKRRLLAPAVLVLCTVVWGSTFIIIKDSLALVHPLALVGWRFGLAALALACLPSVRAGARATLRQGAVLSFWLCLVCVTQTWGLAYISAASSGFITGLFVLFVPLILRVLYGEAVSLFCLFCAVAALCGLWVLSGGVDGFTRGDALTLLAAFASAVHVVLAGRYAPQCPNLAALAFNQFWLCSALSFGLGALAGAPLGVQAGGWGAVLFLTLLASLGAFFLQLWGQKYVPAMEASLIYTLEPPVAAFFAWWLGAEPMTAHKLVGGAIMLSASVAAEARRLRRPSCPPA